MASVDLTPDQLTGLSAPPLQEVEPGRFLQPLVANAYQAMQRAALLDGIDLRIASGWRDFARQQSIIADKFTGKRAVFDAAQHPVDLTALSFDQKLHAILLFSALPGASRHHWGTDLDVWDRAAVDAGYVLQLSAAEYAEGGPFAKLEHWLSQHAARFGFFRPYRRFRGGVAVEPWHLSYQPLASHYLSKLTVNVLSAAIMRSELPDRTAICALLPELYQRYICNIEGEEHV